MFGALISAWQDPRFQPGPVDVEQLAAWLRREQKVFYVSAIGERKRCLLAGPYLTHAEALEDVERVKRIACEYDPRGVFMAWGTAGWTGPMIEAPRGSANALVFKEET